MISVVQVIYHYPPPPCNSSGNSLLCPDTAQNSSAAAHHHSAFTLQSHMPNAADWRAPRTCRAQAQTTVDINKQ